ncbi:ribonuclease H-like domain-containing protein [Tanacetum coccineum]
MDSQSNQTIKLPILQPGEYDLWKMRMEQYLQCIDYTLWGIIENGNAPTVKKIVDGKETVIPPISVEKKAQRRAELKARSTLLMALPNEHQLKNKPELETLSLDDLFNNLKACELEVNGTYSSTTNSHNVSFLSSSSTNSATRIVNTAQGVNTASTQDLQQIHHDDLEEMDLRWNIAMLTIRARRFLKNTRRKLDMANKEIIRFDKLRVECFNCHKMGYFARECRAPRNKDNRNREPTRRTVPVEETTSNALVSQCDGFGYDWSDHAEEDPTNFALMAYSLTNSSSSTNSESVSVVEKPIVETNEPKTARKENGVPIIEDWVSENALTKSMNYKPVVVGNQSNGSAGTKAYDNAGKARVETVPGKYYTLLPLWTQDPPFSSSSKDSLDARFKPSGEEEKKDAEDPGNESENSEVPSTEEPRDDQEKESNVNNTNNINIVSLIVNAASIKDNDVDENIVYGCANDPNIPGLEENGRFSDAEDDDSGADMNNLDTYFQVSHVPTTRIHKQHPLNQVIGDLNSAP